MDQPYTYQNLLTPSTIRLIKISPERVQDKVVCILHHFEQTKAPPYRAVSYLWGNPKPTGAICLGDDTADIHFHPLHENLLRFLDRMWEQKVFNKFLWTDSLCLNQKSTKEKSQQVPRMGEIYANAGDVLIWLGHDSQGEKKMRSIRDWPGPVKWEEIDLDNRDEMRKAEQTEEERPNLEESVKHLLLLPYWRRVWIVQEVALAQKALIAYGDVSFDFDIFRTKVNPFRNATAEFNYQPTVWTLCELRDRNAKMPLWELIQEFYLSASTWTIDKVYGLLGLVAESEDGTSPVHLMEADYSKTVSEVFWDTIFECQAPWGQYHSTLYYLHIMMDAILEPEFGKVDKDVSGLEGYLRSSRTSNRHIQLAEIALRVLDAAWIFVTQNALNFWDWSRAVRKHFSETNFASEKHSELHNAAAIGLALSSTSEAMHSSWVFTQGDQAVSESDSKRQEQQPGAGQRGSAASSEPMTHPEVRISLATPAVKSASKYATISFDTPMVFEIQDVSFRLVVLPDTKHKPSSGSPIARE